MPESLEKYPMNEDELQRITNIFTNHSPTGDQAQRYEALRDIARVFALNIYGMCPNSRERSLALTHLEEVVFFANAAIARNE
jgi:hypothetical protein